MNNYNYIFFDLDGTITQSEFGIIKSVRYALNKMGINVDKESDKDLLKFIGPPIYNSFCDFYGMSDEDSLNAVKYYRAHYEEYGIFDAPLYNGIDKLIADLHKCGKKLFVVTSKPAVIAERIIEHFDLTDKFAAVIGPDKSEKSPDKKELIIRAIKHGNIKTLSQVIMIGDRKYDIEGAKGAKVDSIGVLYGYGSRDELMEAGATYLVEKLEDIRNILNNPSYIHK